jgi:SAM-dependent methyltransferase
MPEQAIKQAVVKHIRSLPDYKKLSMVDLSCGEGGIIAALHGDGCRIEGTHFKEDDYIVEHPNPVLDAVVLHKHVRLDAPLPFADAAYDVVIMTEVIEHVPNHFLLLSEVARITAPGGYLILTTPNIHRLHSRAEFLLTGAHKLIRRRIGWDNRLADLYSHHITPVDFPILHAVLHLHGYAILAIPPTRVKCRHFYLMALYPLILLVSFLEFGVGERDNPAFRAGRMDLFRKMVGFSLLFSEQLVVVARKEGGARESTT